MNKMRPFSCNHKDGQTKLATQRLRTATNFGMRPVWLALVLAIFALVSSVSCLSQATAVDQIGGTISDSTGATIPNAKITATQTGTGFTRSTVSGGDGSYSLTNLPLGPYRIEITASGFKTYKREGIVLQVNTNPTVSAVLQVGDVTQQVEVVADASMAETQSTGVSQVIDQRRVVDLPLNGRQATQLILLSGAAVTNPPSDLVGSKNYPSSTAIAVAGGQANGTYYLLDGGDHNEEFSSVNLPIPFPDVLQEFSVQTNAIPASYGQRAGGVVNVVTKSGTNKFHGNAFEFLRNGAVNAKNYFAKSVDQLKRNQFGGTAGGPILRDKLFFFGGYQGTIAHTAPPTTTSFVPTAQVLQGDFSTILSSTCGSAKTLYDPTTGQPFSPTNQIPVSRFNAQAVNLVTKYLPQSSDPCGKVIYSIPNNSTENQYLGRADWNVSSRHSIFGRYYYTNYANPAVFTNNNLLLTSRAGLHDSVHALTIGDSYTFNASAINSFHFTWSRDRVNRGAAAGVPSAETLGLNVGPSPGNTPQIGVSGYFSTNCGTCALAKVYSASYQVAEDFTLMKGRNQFEFGGEWIRRFVDFQTATQQDITENFSGQITANPVPSTPPSGSALADLLLGLPSTVQQGNLTVVNFVQNYFGFYATDKVRLTSRLSANIGLRWEPYLPATDTKNRETHFDRAAFLAGTKSSVFSNAPPGVTFPGDKDFPRAGTNSTVSNFAPRVGLVWDRNGDGKTVVRAGYGLLYDFPSTAYFDRFGFGPPWASAITLNNPSGGFTNPYAGYPGGNPFPQPNPPPANATFVAAGQYISLPLHLHPSYFKQWNLNVQQQLGPNWLFSANYMGNMGTHLWLSYELNPAVYIPGQCGSSACSTVSNTNQRRVLAQLNPVTGAAFSVLRGVDDGGTSNYQAMLVTLNHRLQRNVSLLANYTWSHCISEGSQLVEIEASYQNPYNRSADRGNCNVDVRQIFNASLLATTPHFTRNFGMRLLADWEFSTIISEHTGLWFSPVTGTDSSFTAVGSDRPNVVGNPNNFHRTLAKWFNTADYSTNAPGTYGNSGRNSLLGPGGFQADMALVKQFPLHVIGDTQSVQLRFEAFNALNHPVFQNPTATSTSSNFGKILSANDPRIWQIAAKYTF